MNHDGHVQARAQIAFTDEELVYAYRKALAKGILKVAVSRPPSRPPPALPRLSLLVHSPVSPSLPPFDTFSFSPG
ncbi:hypothetical protein Naga_104506g1 [Nannochloropsis gaditana]|uniref:Uncharacterized protein n=1 Tax=Nannochloropsis gaditana TaxID=72520 RepID=W7U1X6_9STRA|nr:hypothetical protein Naga_104506g1 [Nannochloropsis gaditana]